MASAMGFIGANLETHDPKKGVDSPSPQVWLAYGLFITLALVVYHFVADGEFSAIMTLGVVCQCLSMLLLSIQTFASGSATGISARSLGLEATAMCCRLSSTLWLNGYLPTDASGDWIFQAFELASLFLAVALVYRIVVVQNKSYDVENDSMPCGSIVLGSFLIAAVFHGDMNLRPLFDTMWMCGHLISAVSVLPQLWLISRTGGRVEALTSHYIVTLAFSRLLCGIFMWHARFDITCEEWVEGWNHAVYLILGAHAVQFFLLGDFVYYYVKAVGTSGFTARVEVPTLSDVV